MRKFWKYWLKIAEVIGNIQMIVILTIIYWTMLLIIAVPFKLFADPLFLKANRRIQWHKRTQESYDLEWLKKQG